MIHCYKCDDEVFDGELARHLSLLGINLAVTTEMEKTIVDL